MSRLQLGDGLSLPLDAVTQTIGVLAKRRAGKSYLARRLAEQLHQADQQIVIVDPKGDWWGIRSSADGKRPGLPIVILGGERGDAPLEATGGEVVAKLVVEERVSVLLDLSLFRKHDLATFMAAFLENLYRLKSLERFRTPLMLIVDEADAVAPQSPKSQGIRGGNVERMLGAAEDIVRRGGQRGIGCTLVTQRSAVLNKNVLTQVQVLIALRTIAPQDLDALNAWIDVHGTPAQQQTLMESLPALPQGDAWIWSPGWPTDSGIFKRIHVLPIETFDSGATPKPGERRVEPKKVSEVDLEALRRQMAATIERAKAEDPRELRRQIVELKKQLAGRQEPRPTPAPKRVEVPVLKDAQVARLEKAIERIRDEGSRRSNADQVSVAHLNDVADRLLRAVRLVNSAVPPPPAPVPLRRPAPPPASPPRRRLEAAPRPHENGQGLRAGERRMLEVLAQFDHLGGVTRDQLALLSGYTRSGTYDTYVGTLRRLDLCTNHGDRLRITEAGRQELGGQEPPAPATTEDLLRLFEGKLREGERRMLRLLVDAYPQALARDELAEKSGYTRSGTFDTYVGTLVRNLLAVRDAGGLRANETLFLS